MIDWLEFITANLVKLQPVVDVDGKTVIEWSCGVTKVTSLGQNIITKRFVGKTPHQALLQLKKHLER